MTSFFIISGFNLNFTAADHVFAKLHTGLHSKGNVVPVDISWRYKTHTRFVEEFVAVYTKHKTDRNILIGNSFGAIVALLSAGVCKPDEIYLCSLSPFTKETLADKAVLSYCTKRFGSRRTEDLKKYSIKDLAQQVNGLGIRVSFLYGEHEKQTLPFLVKYTEKYSGLFNDAKVHEIKNAPHSLRDSNYQRGLLELLS